MSTIVASGCGRFRRAVTRALSKGDIDGAMALIESYSVCRER